MATVCEEEDSLAVFGANLKEENVLPVLVDEDLDTGLADAASPSSSTTTKSSPHEATAIREDDEEEAEEEDDDADTATDDDMFAGAFSEILRRLATATFGANGDPTMVRSLCVRISSCTPSRVQVSLEGRYHMIPGRADADARPDSGLTGHYRNCEVL